MTETRPRLAPRPFAAITLCLWTGIVGLVFSILHQQEANNPLSTSSNTQQSLSPLVTSTSDHISQIRQLTQHLARDYQAVEFLADTSEPGDQLSSHWKTFQNQYPYIQQIGVIEEDSSDHFFVGDNPDALHSTDESSDQWVKYWMQVGLLQRDDILFYTFHHAHQRTQFRFTTPVHYDDMKLGHLYIDFDMDQLLTHTSHRISQQATSRNEVNAHTNIIMLDKEGQFVAESDADSWSARDALSESIGYYYPSFWKGMNSGLSGRFSTVSQTTYFSKLDIPWYQNQIQYFYLIQIAEKPLPTDSTRWDAALLTIWLIGLAGIIIMQRRASIR